ncbi:calcium-binding protein [Shimia sagamensis]|uniref:Ca2+-binding protein, RTX toxin-related n=1 Tax=Shimia sagamensis TaxID=1566352 RepID=A0ABY1PE88_9RHOB|nr:calcium-binding protein [Shimia sagamensis]SMP32288.1 Ca2+-binding protein, RTX toxin-related [Shimia sagamensis]
MPITITVDRSSAPIEVRSDMFGVNLLTSTNEVNGVPNDRYVEAIDLVGATRLRYPAGRAANEQITELDRGQSGFNQIREDVRNYLDWVKANDARTTLVVPALADAHTNQQDIRDWAELVLEYMGDQADLIAGYEIGNEFWQTIDEVEYGEYAADIANALRGATVNGYQPEIWVQTANVAGGASNYKGGNYGSISDADAMAAMAHWDVAHRPSDWSDSQTAEQYYKSLNGYEKRVVKGNLELLEQLDADHNIANGFQTDSATASIDGIVAHYYFDKDVEGYDQSAGLTRSEVKYLDLRFATWEAMLPQDLNIQVTEWNVETGHWNWLGLKAAGVVVEQFQNMLELGVDGADFWTVRHNTSTSIAGGNSDQNAVELTPAGVMLQLMSESLNPEDGSMYAVSVDGFDETKLEVNAYSNGYKSVVYVTSHTESFNKSFSLDLSDLAGNASSWSGRVVGIDASTSDGYSDNAAYDENGDLVQRLGKRTIDPAERADLIEVLGDAYDDELIKWSSGNWKTYLPKPEDIYVRPGVGNPTSLDDFYFATETDVAGSLTMLSEGQLGSSADNISFRLNPWEVIEITLDHSNVVSGDSSAEVMRGGYGVDDFNGSGGDDFLRGYDGMDILVGGTGHDSVYGDSGNDRLEGKSGNDRLYGGSGNDKLVGGDGNDYLRDDAGRDDFVGGNGVDTVSYWGHKTGVNINLKTGKNSSADTYSSIENLYGSDLARDTLYGDNYDNLLYGAAENDRLYGYSGNDTLKGGDGDDYLRDESGRDVFVGGSGQDTVSYWGHKSGMTANLTTGANSGGDSYDSIEHLLGSNIADDKFYGNSNGNKLDGAGGDDVLFGYGGNDVLVGREGTDRLYGGTGSDTLTGGDGNDYLRDESGLDVFDGGAGQDTASYWGHNAGVSVNLLTSVNSSGDTYVSIENLLGSNVANDTLVGDHGDNRLDGAGGSDELHGNDGADYIVGRSGDDSLEGDSGNDRLYGGSGTDTLRGGDGDDYLRDDSGRDIFDGGEGQDTAAYWGHASGVTVNLDTGVNSSGDTYISIENLLGSNKADDHLTGDEQNNYLRGAAGNDTLIGGAGADTLRGDSGNDVMAGGDGGDLFVFHDSFGQDVVTDFDLSQDVLDVSSVDAFTSFSDVISNHASQMGSDVVISVSGSHQITLEDVSLGSLAEHHFDF